MIEIGKKLGERYKILSLLGSGGMATVYLARDLILDRDVAVKVLRYDFHENTDAMRRFQREALSATQLTHPNIVGVYDVGEENGSNYIVMEYVKGTDLKEYIQQKGPISPRESVVIMQQILSAIDIAHRNRIIHRDIKPQNILIDQNGVVKITDFGIAVALSETSLTQTNTLLGSVHYLSPEQARGGMATIRSDIYALGVVFFELLTGHVPFDGESAVSIALKHFQEPLPELTKIMPTIPQSLENIVLKATAKEPLVRYASCQEMQEDLSTALNPERLHEAKFIPQSFTGETKVLQPITSKRPPLKREVPKVTDVPYVQIDESDLEPPPVAPKNKKEKTKPKKKRKWPWIILLLLLALVGIVGTLYMTTPKEIVVPDVSALTEADASSRLRDLKLSVGDSIPTESDTVEKGKVIETDPKAGAKVKEGATIRLKISTGTKLVKLEDYSNKEYEAVRDQLRDLGFTVEKAEEFSQTIPSGKIISQSIASGQSVDPTKQTIKLTVSKGLGPITLRDLSGYNRSAIEDYAKDNGLTVHFTEEASSSVEAGNLISQTPVAGTAIERGGSFSVVLSTGINQRVETREVTIPYLAAESSSSSHSSSSGSSSSSSSQTSSAPKPNNIEIYVEDSKSTFNSAYRTLQITETTTVDLTFTLQGDKVGKYKIVRDGVTIEEATVY